MRVKGITADVFRFLFGLYLYCNFIIVILPVLAGAILCFLLIASPGGLIAIGVFLMRWSPAECLRRFEELATTTFKLDEGKETLTWL